MIFKQQTADSRRMAEIQGDIVELNRQLEEDGRKGDWATIWDKLNVPYRVARRGYPVKPKDLVELVVYLWKVRPNTRWLLYFPDLDEVGSTLYDDYDEAVADANDSNATILRVEI